MSYEIRQQQINEQPVVYAEGTDDAVKAPALMGKLLTKVTEKLKDSGADIMPQPFTRYMKQEDDKVTMWVGFRVRSAVDIDELESDVLPGGNVIVTEHNGTYDTLQQAHEAILDFIESRHLTRNGEPWEIYYSDPDTSEKRDVGRTVVIFPVV